MHGPTHARCRLSTAAFWHIGTFARGTLTSAGSRNEPPVEPTTLRSDDQIALAWARKLSSCFGFRVSFVIWNSSFVIRRVFVEPWPGRVRCAHCNCISCASEGVASLSRRNREHWHFGAKSEWHHGC